MKQALKVVAVAAAFVGAFVVTWLAYFPYSPWGRQEANLRLAKAHQPIVEERLRNLRGAERVKVGIYTGSGGTLVVSGDFEDEQTAELVINEVITTKPPVTVKFWLRVRETNSIAKTVRPENPATRGQPSGSETNRRSEATGSRRSP